VSAFRIGLRPAGQPPKLPPYLLPLWREFARRGEEMYLTNLLDDLSWPEDGYEWTIVTATQRDLADAISSNVRTVQYQLAALHRLYWIHIGRRGGHQRGPSEYHVRLHKRRS
jgi:hypothetical protein